MTSASTWNSAGAVRTALALAAAAALLAAPAPVPAADEEGCLGCHGLPGFVVRDAGKTRSLGIVPAAYDASAHSDLGCRECHADIASIPHGETREVGCGQSCHAVTASGKNYSHEGLYWEYTASRHGGAGSRRVSCLVCHPAPERKENPQRNKLDEARRCAACHRGNPKVREWFQDRHYVALAAGNPRAPSCPDCHSAHRVHPAVATESSVNPRRLAETCSSSTIVGERRGGCHGTLGASAVAGASMNVLPRTASRRGATAAAFAFLAGGLIVGLVVRAGLGLVRGR